MAKKKSQQKPKTSKMTKHNKIIKIKERKQKNSFCSYFKLDSMMVYHSLIVK